MYMIMEEKEKEKEKNGVFGYEMNQTLWSDEREDYFGMRGKAPKDS